MKAEAGRGSPNTRSSKAKSVVKLVMRDDSEACATRSCANRVSDKLIRGESLDVHEQSWLQRLVAKFLIGEDMSAELFRKDRQSGHAPKKVNRDLHIFFQYRLAQFNGEKSVGKRLAKEFGFTGGNGAKQIAGIVSRIGKMFDVNRE